MGKEKRLQIENNLSTQNKNQHLIIVLIEHMYVRIEPKVSVGLSVCLCQLYSPNDSTVFSRQPL